MKYYSSKTVTQILGVTAQTLRNWDREGKLKLLTITLYKENINIINQNKLDKENQVLI